MNSRSWLYTGDATTTLAGLPDRKYFAFGGFMVSKGMSQLINDMMQPMVQAQGANKGQGVAQGDAKALLDGMKQIMDNTKSMAIGYTTPTGALGADSLVQAITVVKGNAKAVAEGERKVLQNMGTWLQAMPQAPGGPQMSFEMLPDTKTAGGVKFEQFRFNMELGNAQNNPQAAQMQQAMSIIYGPNGLTGSMGVVNDNTLLIVQGGTDKLLTDAVAGAKAGQDVLSKRAAAVKGEMPKQIIITGMKYAQGMGVQVKMQLPPNLPPIGISAASEGTAIRVDGHVPTSTVQSVVAGVTQVIMQMQGGGAGAPDGL